MSPPEAIYDEVKAERARAHAKHAGTSMEAKPPDHPRRLAILVEETGEVAREFNDAEHEGRPVDLLRLRKELIQTAAMAVAWADAIKLPVDDRPIRGRVAAASRQGAGQPTVTINLAELPDELFAEGALVEVQFLEAPR